MSEIKVNSIKGVSATSAAITINNTDGSCTANLTNRTNKNLIINGDMRIAQRGTSSTSGGYYTVDRMPLYYDGTDEAPTQAQVDVASGTTPYTLGFRKAFKITNGNQTSGAGANDYIWLQHKMESQDIANSGWNYTSSSSFITLSFWIKSSVAQNFKCYLRSMDGTGQEYPFETGSLTADTWTKITKTIPGNSNLTFDNDANQGFQINILAFYGTGGTDNSVTENAWSAYSPTARMKDNTSTWYTTNDATLEVTGLQLEVGSVATDFEHRSFGQELDLCRRYYYNLAFQNSAGTQALFNGSGYDSSTIYHVCVLPTPMRAIPTIEQNTSGNYFQSYGNGGSNSYSTLNIDNTASTSVLEIYNSGANSRGGGVSHFTRLNSATTDGKFRLTAEL